MRNNPRTLPYRTRGRRSLLKLLIAGIILIAAISGSLNLYVENLWFDSLGFSSVYWYGIEARSITFLIFFVTTTAVLFGAFRILLAVAGESRRPFLQIQGRYVDTPSPEDVKVLASGIAVVLGLLVAIAFSSGWLTYALYSNQPAPGGVSDPIMGKSLNFFFFTLPVLEAISAWLIIVSVVVVIAAVLLFGIGMTVQLRGISLAGSLILVAIALRMFLARYELLLADHNLFSGMSYVDDKIVTIGLLATGIALLVAAALLLFGKSGVVIRSLAVVIPVFTYLVGVVLVPWYVTTFIVRPNELARETPYIRHNIDYTRRAFGLNAVEEMPFVPRQTNAVFDPEKHRSTLNNMRLWDWQALQDTLRQIQEIRTYYDFPDVDIDRYVVDGKLTATMLASREIDINKLPPNSRNWVNERLIYTHGYGVTMNSASAFTHEGLPELILSNMPVQSTRPEVQVKRPEIYFGELSDWPVYVKTKQKEFNYPEGEANNFSTYGGTGGIRMGGLFRRLLLALEVGDLTTVPFSDDITPDSSLLLHRNILARISRLAPFLELDEDPYIVVGEDGALYWMVDAYTTSDQYPYARHIDAGRDSINYIRNSVKIVVDAYNGDVRFYVFDPADPLIQAYQNIFPVLFQPRSAMPAFLASHIRYPEKLFQLQALMYTAYHVDNEQVFYNREDVWALGQQTRSQSAGQNAQAIEPFYILMTFPGEEKLEFVSILPFTPARRNNMIGWLAARCDGEEYGKLRAYDLPKTSFFDGPLQIQARIDQDAQLSSQLTLWNQQGSAVIRGNLLVIPIDDVVLFAEPIYLQAQRSPMPALRLIVLATQDRLAYATTFDEALRLLLAGGGGALTQATTSTSAETGAAPPGRATTGAVSPSSAALIGRANQALSDYRRLTAEGKLGEAGAKLDELKTILEQLNQGGGPAK